MRCLKPFKAMSSDQVRFLLTRLGHRSLAIRVEGLPRTTVISTGQHILIEGDDEDNPYVAKVVRLFGDGELKFLVTAVLALS